MSGYPLFLARRLTAAAMLCAIAAAATPLAAQSPIAGTLTFRGDSTNNGAIQSNSLTAAVGPYRADLTFGSLFSGTRTIIWCVDWAHFAPAAGSADSYWLSAVRPGADLTKTRQNNLTRYLAAAWMFEQVDANGGLYNNAPTRYSAKNVQGSVWELMDPSAFDPSGNPAGANSGLSDNVNYGNSTYFNVSADVPSGLQRHDLQYDWYVLTDYITGNERDPLNQEFMVAVRRVPEPGTYALMATGLAGLLVATRRRRARA